MAEDSPQFRLHILIVVAFSLFGVLVARLWFLQVVGAQELQVEAVSQVTRVVPEQGPRGSILDRNGNVLAEDRPTTVVEVDRMTFKEALDDDEQDEMLLRLALEINRSGGLVKVTDIARDLDSDTFGRFDSVPIAYDVSDDLLIYVGERQDEFPGVSVSETTVRHYPYGNLAAHVLGYVGPINDTEFDAQPECDPLDSDTCKPYQPGDEHGKSGIERQFEDVLRGHPGRRTLIVDRREEVVGIGPRVVPRRGEDVWLTIDIDIQAVVEAELAKTLDAAREQSPDVGEAPFAAPAGAAVILDPLDGQVVAMASYPTYDPAAFVGGISQREFDRLNDEANDAPILNRAIQGAYAPGSTFKLVTGYAAMAEGVIGPNGIGEIDERMRDQGTYVLPFCLDEAEVDLCTFESPYTGERGVTMSEALTVSSDVYFYRIAAEGFWQEKGGVDDEAIQSWARRFGLGSPTGIALPFERAGIVPDRELFKSRFEESPDLFLRGTWQAGDTINFSIGQGDLLVTPLQMANVYATFVSDVKHQPNIVASIRDAEGEVIQDFGPRALETLDTPDWLRRPLVEGLIGVTARAGEGGGTAYKAFNLPGEGGSSVPLNRWPVLGKTGTAEVRTKADTSWFVGVGPVPDPALPATANVEPEYAMSVILEEAGFGSRAAAPMVARVFDYLADGVWPKAPTVDEREACYVAQESSDLDAVVDADAVDVPETGEVADDVIDPCDPTTGQAVVIIGEGTD